MDFRTESLGALAARVQRRTLSARELTAHALSRIEALDPAVNAFCAVDGDRAMAEAAALDERIARGGAVGPLAGVPIGVKDLEDAAGFPTSQGSLLFAGGPPARRDSVLVARLRAAGCVVVGKTNTPELGYKGDTVNRVFGATRNPFDLSRSAGGSSGGTAAAVAAGMVPLATGSDGGGSIRIPSAVCGLSGLKASLGRVPSGGPVPPGWASLSVKGPMARRIRDVVLALDACVGPDPTDLRSLPAPRAPWSAQVIDVHPPRRVGWAPTLGYAEVDAEVAAVCEAAVRRLAAEGTEVVEVDPVFDGDPVKWFLTFASVGNLHAVEPYRDRWADLDPGLASLLEHAAGLRAVDVVAAEDAAHRLNHRLVEVLRDVPLLLTPVMAAPTPRVGEVGAINGRPDPNYVRFTYPFNLTRSPAGTVTAGYGADGMPIGLQVVGPQHGDVAVLRALVFLEDLLGNDRLAAVG